MRQVGRQARSWSGCVVLEYWTSEQDAQSERDMCKSSATPVSSSASKPILFYVFSAFEAAVLVRVCLAHLVGEERGRRAKSEEHVGDEAMAVRAAVKRWRDDLRGHKERVAVGMYLWTRCSGAWRGGARMLACAQADVHSCAMLARPASSARDPAVPASGARDPAGPVSGARDPAGAMADVPLSHLNASCHGWRALCVTMTPPPSACKYPRQQCFLGHACRMGRAEALICASHFQKRHDEVDRQYTIGAAHASQGERHDRLLEAEVVDQHR
eukprot:351952-Chlamydomonas_euryale.AAC.8